MVNEVTRFVSGETKTVKAGNFDALHIDSNAERLGVGTLTPARTLHVQSDDTTVLRIESTTAGTPGIELTGSGGSGELNYNSSTGQWTFGTDLEATDSKLSVDVLSVPDGGAAAARINVGDGDDLKIYHVGGTNVLNSSGVLTVISGGATALTLSASQLVTCAKGLTVNTTAASSALTVTDGTSITTLSTSATCGASALRIDQNDADEPFINYDGSSAASAAANISTWTTGATLTGYVRVAINGTDYWMPYYTAPTS